MKTADFHKILIDTYGAQMVRTKGGHQIWRTPDGTMFVTTCAGRHKDVSRRIINTVARALGVPMKELMR